jgi:type I restriction enzyme R subunit
LNAIIAASDAHEIMSGQALASETVRVGLKEILLDHAGLYESLKAVATTGA